MLEGTREIVVAAADTFTGTALETLLEKSVDPLKVATIELFPTGRLVVSTAAPAEISSAEPKVVPPEVNVTEPVGVLLEETVAVSVTDWPATAELFEEASCVVVSADATVTATGTEALPVKEPLPL